MFGNLFSTNLENLIGSRWILFFFDNPENSENFVDDFTGDEAAEVQIHVLHERHRQERNSGKMFDVFV